MRKRDYLLALGLALVVLVVGEATVFLAGNSSILSSWDLLWGFLFPAAAATLVAIVLGRLWLWNDANWRLCIYAAVLMFPAMLDSNALANQGFSTSTQMAKQGHGVIAQHEALAWLHTGIAYLAVCYSQVALIMLLVTVFWLHERAERNPGPTGP